MKSYSVFRSTVLCLAASFLALPLLGTDCVLCLSPMPCGPTENYGLLFDGSNDYVKVGPNSTLDLTGAGDLTLSARVRIAGTRDSQIVWRGDSQAAKDPYCLRFSSGQLVFRVDSANNEFRATSTEAVDGLMHFWTGVCMSEAGKLYLYKDGVLDSTTDFNGDFDYTTWTMSNMIGAVDNGRSQNFNGLIDEVRVWDVARTQSEIAADMNSMLKGNEPGLVACWTFNEGRGFVAKDIANGISCVGRLRSLF